jgi:addiction module HigA family antidote
MKNPPHPGGFVMRQCIEPLGLTITRAAEALGVTRTTLSELVNGKRGVSPEMAVRLSKVFGGSAQSWLVQQAQYDLAHVRTDTIRLKRLEVAKPHAVPPCRRAMKLLNPGTLQPATRQYGSVGRCCNATGLLVADAAPVLL